MLTNKREKREPASASKADQIRKKVKSEPLGKRKKQAFSSGSKLERTTFRTSRDMDFFSEKELITQTGHNVDEWPLVFLKEIIDNALDACEGADIAPLISIVADECGITVADNGPGLPEETLRAQLDFSIRVSNCEAYVGPTRGAQGNALKTLLPMGRVIDPDNGRLVIEASGHRHALTCGADPISQRAVVNDDAIAMPTKGTSIRIEWGEVNDDDGFPVWPFDGLLPTYDWEAHFANFANQFREIIEGFAIFNPHAVFQLNWFGKCVEWQATNDSWPKWRPDKPTSPHWYEQDHLQRLIGAYVTHGNENKSDRLVTDFLSEFDGLSGSQKRSKVLADTNLQRATLSSLVVDGSFDTRRIGNLLDSMKKHTRAVKSPRLGVIGEDHLRQRLLALGVQPESFKYSKKLGKESLPWVLESAFGFLAEKPDARRRIFAGANWSAAIKNPFRSFGQTGEGLEAALSEMRAGRNEPVVFVLHLAHPRIQYTDRGKSALVIGGTEK